MNEGSKEGKEGGQVQAGEKESMKGKNTSLAITKLMIAWGQQNNLASHS